MRMHRAGASISDTFGGIARLAPEPFCARTYSLIAIAEERGVDLADGLLTLSESVREARRESIKRSATKRRAAMLLPTVRDPRSGDAPVRGGSASTVVVGTVTSEHSPQ